MMEQPGGFVGLKMGRECIPFAKDDLINKLLNGAGCILVQYLAHHLPSFVVFL